MEKGKGKYENDMLLIVNKEIKGAGFDWIRENYGVAFKFIKEKQCDRYIPIRSKNAEIVQDKLKST